MGRRVFFSLSSTTRAVTLRRHADYATTGPPARVLYGPEPSGVEPSALAAMRRPMLGHLDSTLKAATAMPHRSSGSPSPASGTPRGPAWDAALRPAQHRAGLDRARREERRLADAQRQRLIAVWLRELAND